MKKANKPIKDKEPAKKKVSLKPDPKAQKEMKYVKKNFFTTDEDEVDEEEEDLDLPEIDDSTFEEADFNEDEDEDEEEEDEDF
jgi:hypothetical protein